MLLAGIILSQKYSFANQKKIFETLTDNPLFVPKAQILQKYSFGFENLITDLVWLRTIQYIGGNARSSNYRLLYHYLDCLTDLDAQFYMPYFVAQILLPEINQADNAILISKKGLRSLPKRWEIPYYMGYIYYYYLDDFEKGAQMYALASSIPGVLSSAKRMEINLTSKSNKHVLALQMWLNVYEKEQNQDVKDLIAKKIVREKNFVTLENALQKYIKKYGNVPLNLDILAQKKLIKEIPIDPIEKHKKYQIEEQLIILK